MAGHECPVDVLPAPHVLDPPPSRRRSHGARDRCGGDARGGAAFAPDDPASAIAVTPTAVAADPLVGLWSAHDDGGAGTPVAFYYFHGDGHGLYRYGRVGLTNTNSFDYTVEAITSRCIRKTGAPLRALRHRTSTTARRCLRWPILLLRTVRYRQRQRSAEHDAAGAGRVDGRLWLDRALRDRRLRLRCTTRAGGIDGRGVLLVPPRTSTTGPSRRWATASPRPARTVRQR
ncbi:MAG: hypothetical protein U0168_11320 [Nannocystaceae bacterium]